MKINNKDINEMTKREIHDIYLEAACGEIEEPELLRIREALYELTPLCQFTKDEYVSLIETLDSLPDEALEGIKKGFFSLFYKRNIKNTAGMPEDFDVCDSLVNAIYSNYKGLGSFEDYLLQCEFMSELTHFTIGSGEDVMKFLDLMNPELANLLRGMRIAEAQKLSEKLKGRDLYAQMSYSQIKWQLLTAYMMFIDEFKDSYHIVPDTLEVLLDRLNDEQIKRLGYAMKLKDSNEFYAMSLLNQSYFKAKMDDEYFRRSFNPSGDEII